MRFPVSVSGDFVCIPFPERGLAPCVGLFAFSEFSIPCPSPFPLTLDLSPVDHAFLRAGFFKSAEGASGRNREAKGLSEGDKQGVDPGFGFRRKDRIKRPEAFVRRAGP